MLRLLFRAFLALLVVGLLLAAGAWYVMSRGFSARAAPSPIEEFVALRLRGLATPPDAKERQNPVAGTRENIRSAAAHFVDHCAICHGIDGSGRSELGPGMYPKPPDLRRDRTQRLSDGELFYIIQNGVRFTGMPGFGSAEGTGEDSWKLVHFIRKLPSLTPPELDALKKLNGRTPAGHHGDGPAPPHRH